MSSWDEIWNYVYSHNEKIHVFGSKEGGWIRLSYPGGNYMIRKGETMGDAEQVVGRALLNTYRPALMPKDRLK